MGSKVTPDLRNCRIRKAGFSGGELSLRGQGRWEDQKIQREDPTGDKDDKEKSTVCSDGPPIRWEQGRNPTKGLKLFLEMPSLIEISSWHETVTNGCRS